MPPLYYDLHIHTALSPCADNDMLPGNIIGMAIVCNLDLIAITDHNSMANTAAVIKASERICKEYNLENGIIVLPGIEVTTSEEVHVLCLFDDLETGLGFEEELSRFYSGNKNRSDIFGEQLICDSTDHVTGNIERMLIDATNISFHDLYALAQKHEGAFVPAHVNRDSFSVMSNLGFLPPDLPVATVEVASLDTDTDNNKRVFEQFSGKKHIFSSDAHKLENINENINSISVPQRSAKSVVDYLRF